jgi:hypothetical protein
VTVAPELDAKGELLVAEDTLAVLIAHAADPVHAALQGEDAQQQLALLHAAGVIQAGSSHPAIRGALAAIVRPELCTLELAYGGRSMQGWVSHSEAALLLPAADGDERRRLVPLHPTLLPEVLARLVDLGPRPRPASADPVPYEDDVVGELRRRWRLGATWTLEDGSTGGDGLEVLDADTGLWMIAPRDDELMAWPVTPTFVWRHIVRLVMRRAAEDERAA